MRLKTNFFIFAAAIFFPAISFAAGGKHLLDGDPITTSSITAVNLQGGGTQCLQTNNGGQITGTGSACGSGSGSLPLPSGATNYIQVSDTLQSGSTFYVSSGTARYFRLETQGGTPYPSSRILFTGSDSQATFGNLYFVSASNELSIGGTPSGSNRLWVTGGDIGVSGDMKIYGQNELRFYDSFNNNYVSFRSSETVGHTANYVLPISTGAVGTVLSIGSINADGTVGTEWATAGSGTSPLSGFYLKDSSNVAWKVYTSTTGVLLTTNVGSVPSGTLYRTSVVMQDSSFAFWTVTVNTSGVLITTSGGSTAQTIQDILINDSTGFTWVYTVNTSGALVTS